MPAYTPGYQHSLEKKQHITNTQSILNQRSIKQIPQVKFVQQYPVNPNTSIPNQFIRRMTPEKQKINFQQRQTPINRNESPKVIRRSSSMHARFMTP